MSQNSSPGRSSPQSYDSQYDIYDNFTSDITSKMRVPDKICVIGGTEQPDLISHQPAEIKSRMNVPERILVAGDNKHIAVRESLPELKFDTPFPVNLPNLILAPPPNVLTVDEYPYPSLEVKPEKSEVKKKLILDQDYNGGSDLHDTSLNTSINPDDELAKLRAQMRHLSRRVLAIEQENQQRQQRELIMYTVGIAYFILKGFLWLHRHF